jgi:PA14 domain
MALLVLFFLEPTLARRTSERVLPLVAVVVDQSGSMAVKDEAMAAGPKLAEAIGLGLLPASIRPLKTNAAEQATSDQAIVTSAAAGSPVARGLAALARLTRYDRAMKLARQQVVPALEGKARVRVFGMDTGLAPLDLSKPETLLPNRATDFGNCLSSLARNWAQEYVGGVILLSDGRQTAGADPAPVARSLRARGALVSGIMIGDPGVPPDAVVAEISGSGEVFLGENVPMTVRYRITGAGNLDWDLVVTHNGKELARRSVRGNGEWQYESFAFAATNAGLSLYQARLELAREQGLAGPLNASGSVTLELWNRLNGSQVSDLVNSPAFANAPSSKSSLSQLAYANRGEQYGGRIRGYLVPPQSGNYIFSLSSDDASELWVSPTEFPKDKVKVAYVSGAVAKEPGHHPQSPRSLLFRDAAQAGLGRGSPGGGVANA